MDWAKIWAWIVRAAKKIDDIAMDWLFPDLGDDAGDDPPWYL